MKVSFTSEQLQEVQRLVSRYPEGREKSALIPVLHLAQDTFGGWLSTDVMDYVASLLQLKPILKTVECLGACGYAPMLQLGEHYKEHLTKEKIDALIESCYAKSAALN